ncbi:L-threonylcarbamoyladenylate synthase [Pusillimonas sp.]|uniref:L-threonylcarbamoyladenylate synthase n=1 Tax=Pusillimonas sp. TaxID=3040095 RepID=UPI0029B95C2B|nr:L-threonylcarbamoyladenylate synthase [Pusillimonas sp.]MDX3895352.1 L-threonylcarbamoyladenylate synthase [Pusillimonas sp.]
MEAVIERAARRLLDGGLVAFPTETVYGLGADAENVQAIAGIYAAKGRPANHPVIVHLAPGAALDYWAARVPPQARLLIDAFWPGPLTLILPRADRIPADVAGGQDSIGLRCPSHPVAQALLRRFAELKGGHGGVAAPSANQFGQVSPTLAEHVRAEFPAMAEDELLILEGGASEVGIESTILDLSRLEQGVGPVILRPGHITAAQIGEVLGLAPEDLIPAHAGEDGHGANQAGQQEKERSEQRGTARDRSQSRGQANVHAPRVSGSLKAHYAPRTPLQVLPRQEMLALLDGVKSQEGRVACVMFEPPRDALASGPDVDCFAAPAQPGAYARELYALLRRLDQGGYTRLIFEQPPRSAPWRAVNDRLGRAAAAFTA